MHNNIVLLYCDVLPRLKGLCSSAKGLANISVDASWGQLRLPHRPNHWLGIIVVGGFVRSLLLGRLTRQKINDPAPRINGPVINEIIGSLLDFLAAADLVAEFLD